MSRVVLRDNNSVLVIRNGNYLVLRDGPAGSSGGGGVTSHGALTGRSAADSHPISAVTNLVETLAAMVQTEALQSGLDAIVGGAPAGGDTLGELHSRLEAIEALGDLSTDAELIAAVAAILGTADADGDTLGELQALMNLRLLSSANLSDVANAATARTNLGVAYGFTAGTVAEGHRLPIVIHKSTTETVNNDSTLQPDDSFVFPLEASSKYLVEINALYGASSAADIQFDLNGPSGSSGFLSVLAPLASSSSSPVSAAVGTGTTIAGLGSVIIIGGPDQSGGFPRRSHAVITAVVTTTTAGNLTFRWAQNVSGATDASVFAGSWARYQKVA